MQMKRQKPMFNPCLLTSSILLVFLLASCAQSPKSCPPQHPADLSGAIAFAADDQLAFRFPLDELGNDVRPFPANFCTSGGTGSAREYHAAEDYHLPAGTPVYAIADGKISFSGPMGGYGWLIIIDHPQANLYSLYGHLSPSRWRIESGTVKKGDMIAYLGDPDENGGSPEQPLRPHLHLGVRAGQRADYSYMGEWRWMAGWIKPCPQDLGWLRPSAIITSQAIPAGGFPNPAAGFLEMWWNELAAASIIIFGCVCLLVNAIKKDKHFLPVISGGILFAAGWYLSIKTTRISYTCYAMAVLLSAVGIYKIIRHSTKGSRAQS
jgi:murein DD-endopeptidase MepM/ murein hydrolase activator NlpD